MRFCSTRVAAGCRALAPSLAALQLTALLASGCESDKFRAQASGGQSGATDSIVDAGAAGAEDLAGGAGGAPSAAGASVAGESGSPSEEEGGASSSGAAGTDGAAGAAVQPVTSCDCRAGSYCQDGTTTCRNCLDFTRLQFGPPEKLTTLANAPFSVERFPRSAPKASALFYTSGVTTQEQQLWYSATPLSGVGAPLSEFGVRESGPLYAPGLFGADNFFFDRLDPATQRRKIMIGVWSGTGLSGVELAGRQLNRVDSSDYSVAVAAKVGHMYWMSTRSGEPELLYDPSTVSVELTPQILDLQVKVGGTASCPRTGEDATPWVNLDGTLLLFRNPSLDERCQPNDSGAFDLFAVPLVDGLPASSALPLSGLNYTGGYSSETDASLSPDACSIYFASNNENRDFDLYRAPRK